MIEILIDTPELVVRRCDHAGTTQTICVGSWHVKCWTYCEACRTRNPEEPKMRWRRSGTSPEDYLDSGWESQVLYTDTEQA